MIVIIINKVINIIVVHQIGAICGIKKYLTVI